MQITGGYLKSRKIDSPKSSNVRPTLSQIRESIFSVLFSITEFDGKSFLDAFAGSGIMGFEAVSRGFSSVCFFEKDKKTFFLLKENAKKLGIQADFYPGDTIKLLSKLSKDGKSFDVIYVDPPYQSGLYDSVLKIVKEKNVLTDNGIIILEHPADLGIKIDGYELIKQKTYSGKTLSFLNLNSYKKNS